MAHEEILKFENLKLGTSYPNSLGFFDNGHASTQNGKGKRAAHIADASHSNAGAVEGSDGVLNGMHTSTPPIPVPCSEEQHHGGAATDELEFNHNPRYVQPSPLEQFARSHQTSISHKPELSLDTRSRNQLEKSPVNPDGKLGSSVDILHNRKPACGDPASSFPITPSRRVFFSPTAENCAIEEPAGERPTSLTSLSTASPIIEEVQTPPEASRDMLLSPFAASPNVYRPASLDDPRGWSNPVPQPFGSRSKSYTLGRDGSLRHNMRQSSRRSTNSSGKSPASTFLSLWSREEVPPLPDDEGQVVGTDYVIGKQIGFGGFSTVKEAFKVKQDGGPERSAVKIVRKHLAGQTERENDQAQAEFDHEVRIWRYLNHTHILQLDAVYETDYATFCFTRLTTRGTLFDLVRKHRRGLDMSVARKYAYQLASAIRYLHEDARVVHRDIKLENCLLDTPVSEEPGDVSQLILCDFGMAEWMTSENGDASPDPYDNAADRPPPKAIGPSDTSTSIAGSLEYASPELLASTGGLLDPIVDVWAFGVVVFALLVGSRPFQHPFKPKIKMNIMSGMWDKTAVMKCGGDTQEREDALELIQGCLEMDPLKRWTIREALESRWLKGCCNSADDPADAPRWRF
ncbi:CAMK protein kinase [Helicocarpus griseus UAMH5409]|uniref:CAMK protein kinase n=1 Tax=Helicocarpus griseus UAMH5409 TaxID=1447875 RepID=A0A2B7Y9S4_9EURO|nr:CAMK protein kinase [Helicocarpus griseus UAMH5409]